MSLTKFATTVAANCMSSENEKEDVAHEVRDDSCCELREQRKGSVENDVAANCVSSESVVSRAMLLRTV